MSSLTRHSLEQIEVAAGTLAPEQTQNHQGPRSRCTAPARRPEENLLTEYYSEDVRICNETARPGRKTWVGRAAEPGP